MQPLLLSHHPEIELLKKLAREHGRRVYLVGGFLRDRQLGRSGKDLDFAVSRGAIDLSRRFARAIKGAFVLLDEESGCARVARKRSPGEGVWTYDFADFRAGTLKGDLARRDFTINTLAVDLFSVSEGKILPAAIKGHRMALGDIRRKVIRMVGRKAFLDDPLRLLRAYSLRAQLGFSIDPGTRRRIKAECGLIRNVSPERVREEFFKILASPRAALVVRELDRDGLLFEIMPQVRVMYGVVQGGYHHLDVWKHAQETLRQLEISLKTAVLDEDLRGYLDEELGGGHSRRAVLKLAALLHDIGKPDTKKREPGGRTSFHGHEHTGRRIGRIIAKNLMLSTRERYALEDMVSLHLRPGYLSNFKRPSDKAVFRFFRDARDEAVSILLLSMADQRSTRGPLTTAYDIAHHEAISLPLIGKYFERKKEKPFVRLLTGHDLIKELGLKPGPHFTAILAKVEEAQHLGKALTRDEAMAIARKAAHL